MTFIYAPESWVLPCMCTRNGWQTFVVCLSARYSSSFWRRRRQRERYQTNDSLINVPSHGCAANLRKKSLYVSADLVIVLSKTTKKISRSLRSDFGNVEDQKTNIYFSYESRDTLKSFYLFITIKTITKLNLGNGDKFTKLAVVV